MQRDLLNELIEWKNSKSRLPLLLRGARQVGKTYLIDQLGHNHFESYVSINFELDPEYKACFKNLRPTEILKKIEVLTGKTITPGKTLLFLDEIQNCPNAIMSLRYFKEQLPNMHVIGTGSLLEFALSEKGFKMPVGRVQYLYLKPLSFKEFLNAIGHYKIFEFIESYHIDTDFPDVIHMKAMSLLKEYATIGGMPMVVKNYVDNNSYKECQNIQSLLLKTYSDDFAKYSSTTQHRYLQRVYDQAPGLIGQQIKYAHVAADMDYRHIKTAIHNLSKAGVIGEVFSTSAAGLPFISYANKKKFKLLFLDIGLVKRATNLDVELLMNDNLMLLNRGALAEQLVGQELMSYNDPHEESRLFYWSRDKKGSNAEVDYIINIGSKIIPIEVKAGKTGSLKSLHQIMSSHQLPVGVRVSAKGVSYRENILSVPFYLVSQLPRLIDELASR